MFSFFTKAIRHSSSSGKSNNDVDSSGLFIWLGERILETQSPTINATASRKLLLPVVQSDKATIYDDDSPERIVSIVNNHYENVSSDYIGGMGENDPGVWFAPTTKTNKDSLEYLSLIQQGIELVKEVRHGVPIGLYTSGAINYSTQNIQLNEIGIDFLHVSLFASSPGDYQKATGLQDLKDARNAFGQVCSLISDASEMGISVKVGVVQSQANPARDLAYSLGAIEVHVFPDL